VWTSSCPSREKESMSLMRINALSSQCLIVTIRSVAILMFRAVVSIAVNAHRHRYDRIIRSDKLTLRNRVRRLSQPNQHTEGFQSAASWAVGGHSKYGPAG
jgi:hypothetical protein